MGGWADDSSGRDSRVPPPATSLTLLLSLGCYWAEWVWMVGVPLGRVDGGYKESSVDVWSDGNKL